MTTPVSSNGHAFLEAYETLSTYAEAPVASIERPVPGASESATPFRPVAELLEATIASLEPELAEAEEPEAEFFDAEDLEAVSDLFEEEFPSGAVLQQTTGATGRDQEHWDPNGAGLPLLATGSSTHGIKLARSFTVKELVTSGGRTASVARISPELVRVLQAIRDRAGKPVTITSGYRSWARNRALYQGRGKKPTLSRHCSGQAADIKIRGLSGIEIAKLAIDAAGTELGIGVGGTFAHVDVRGRWTLWTYTGGAAGQAAIREVQAYRDAASRSGQTPRPPTPITPPASPGPTPSPAGAGLGGQVVVDRHPMLRSHAGSAPDLILRWNRITGSGEVDVVVHLHGFSGRKAAMSIVSDKLPNSGLDFADPGGAAGGRTRPTLALLPRGHFYGGKSGSGYSFPALVVPGAIDQLVADGLARFSAHTGLQARRGRLIITAHSGGGAPLMRILAADPDEVHVFDGLYGSADALIRWAGQRIARDVATPAPVPPAMRVLFRAGSPGRPGTEPHSEAVARSLCRLLAAPGAARLAPWFRVERTPVGHNEMPKTFGWSLLADPAGDLPRTTRRDCAGRPAGQSRETVLEWEAQLDPEPVRAEWETLATEEQELEPGEPSAETDEADATANEALWESESPPAVSFAASVAEQEDFGDVGEVESDLRGWLESEDEEASPSAQANIEPEAEAFAEGELDPIPRGWLEAADTETEAERWPETEHLASWAEDEAEAPTDMPETEAWDGEDETDAFETESEQAWGAAANLAGETATSTEDLFPGLAPNDESAAAADREAEPASEREWEWEAPGHEVLDRLLEFESGAGTSLTDRIKAVAALAFGPTLRRGSKGQAVAALQRGLNVLGHDLAVDGDFGPNTERAVRAFQGSAGIAVDGIVGPQTKTALAQELARRVAPGPVPPTPPQPTPAGTALCDAIARVAEEEYRRWHPASGPIRETDTAATPILQRYYRDGVGEQVSAQDLQSAAWQASHPWSAVFVSAVMRTAGAGDRGTPAAFPYSRAHQGYIRATRRNRVNANTANPFWAYRATEVAPQVGDLICASRSNSGATYDNIGDPQFRATHCDIVTRVSPGSLRVIGGNVRQNVDTKTIRTQPDGRLALDGDQSRFFAVVRCRGTTGAGPVPAPPVPVPPTPTPTGAGGFTNAASIDRWFRDRTGRDFIAWFSATQAGKRAWAGKSIGGPRAAEGFAKLWDNIPVIFDQPSISLEQFLALMSIVINETGGRIWPISERVGTKQHPGIAYAFDAIPGTKRSYNAAPNRTAGSLFRDPVFLGAFGSLPLAARVRNTTDPRWDGTVYPVNDFPTSTDPAVSGIILEADFYKFRGRGFIQTTFRSAYQSVIRWIQSSTTAHQVVAQYRAAWAGRSADEIATVTTNADWDRLFQETDAIVACAAIRLHNRGTGNYLAVSSDRPTLEGRGPGSAWWVGRKVSGSGAYGDLFKSRVLQLLDAVPR